MRCKTARRTLRSCPTKASKTGLGMSRAGKSCADVEAFAGECGTPLGAADRPQLSRKEIIARIDDMSASFKEMARHWSKRSPERAAAYRIAYTFSATLASQAHSRTSRPRGRKLDVAKLIDEAMRKGSKAERKQR
jgi:hypothetical protein